MIVEQFLEHREFLVLPCQLDHEWLLHSPSGTVQFPDLRGKLPRGLVATHCSLSGLGGVDSGRLDIPKPACRLEVMPGVHLPAMVPI